MEKGNQWTKISWNRGISSSSHFELFCKYVFFLNCIKLTEKYLCWSLFLIKLIAVTSKQQFSAKHACLNLATEKQEQRLYACFDLFIVEFECIHAQTRWSGCIELLNECLSLFLCLWCWIWANMYAFMYIFYASIDVRENFVFDSRLRALYKKKLLWVKSNLCSSQDKTIEFYSYSEHFFMRKIFYPVQYFTQIVSMLAMFGQFFIYIFSCQATYLTACFEYLCDVLYALRIHFPSLFYHLTWWQKQICCLLVSFELSIQRYSETEVANHVSGLSGNI